MEACSVPRRSSEAFWWGSFLGSFFETLLETAGEVKVAISHGMSAKNKALDLKEKLQNKVSKLTPKSVKRQLGEGVLGRQNQDPKKDTHLDQKMEK